MLPLIKTQVFTDDLIDWKTLWTNNFYTANKPHNITSKRAEQIQHYRMLYNFTLFLIGNYFAIYQILTGSSFVARICSIIIKLYSLYSLFVLSKLRWSYRIINYTRYISFSLLPPEWFRMRFGVKSAVRHPLCHDRCCQILYLSVLAFVTTIFSYSSASR